MNDPQTVYAFAWFQAEEWQLLKEAVDDPESLDDSYQDWRQSAEDAIAELRAEGMQVRKISIKMRDLLEWCELKGLKPDASARSQVTALLSQQRNK